MTSLTMEAGKGRQNVLGGSGFVSMTTTVAAMEERYYLQGKVSVIAKRLWRQFIVDWNLYLQKRKWNLRVRTATAMTRFG